LETANETFDKNQVWHAHDSGYGTTLWSGCYSTGRDSQPAGYFFKISGTDYPPLKKCRGAKGGHILSKTPEEVTVGEIVAVLEGGDTLIHCDKDTEGCERVDSCLTRYVWMEAATAMFERLSTITFANLIKLEKEVCQNKFIDYLTSEPESNPV
jgi:hypothetical protein